MKACLGVTVEKFFLGPNKLEFYDVSFRCGYLYFSLGLLDKAIYHFQYILTRVEPLKKFLSKHVLSEVDLLHRLGKTYFFKEDYFKALSYSQKALTIMKQLSPNPDLEGNIHICLGDAYLAQGMHSLAVESYKAALKIAENVKEGHLLKAEVCRGMGSIAVSLGDYSKGIEDLNEALLEKGDIFNQMGVLVWIGDAYYGQEKFKKAFYYYEKASEMAQNLHPRNQYWEKTTHEKLGDSYLSLSRYPESMQHYERALECAQAMGEEINTDKIYTSLGHVFFRSSNYQAALMYYKKSYFTAQYPGKLAELFDLEKYLGRTYRALGEFELAKCYLYECTRSYTFIQHELIGKNQWQITVFEKQAEAYMELENLLLQEGKIEKALEASDSRRSCALIGILLKKLSLPNHSSLSRPLKIEQMKALASDHRTIFIIYTLAPDNGKSFGAWIITSQNIFWKELFITPIEKDFKDFTSLFKSFPFGRTGEEVAPAASSIPLLEEMFKIPELSEEEAIYYKEIIENFKEHLKKWYEALILPLEEYLTNAEESLTIVPDGFLSQLPFAAFQDQKGMYLIEKYPISIQPSIKILSLLKEIKVKNHPSGSLLVGFPKTNNPKDRPLPLAAEEAKEIGALLGLQPAQILLQGDPTVTRVLREIGSVCYIHFACHGETGHDRKLDSHSVFQGRLKLTPDDKYDDGCLYAQQVAELSLQAELVFMSACYSGTGSLQKRVTLGLFGLS